MLTPQKIEELREFFKDLVRANNLDGIILADTEGLGLTSYIQEEGVDEDTIAAAGAAIFTAGLMTVNDARKKGLDQVILHSPDGYIIFTSVGDYVIGLLSPKDAKLGVLKVVINQIANKIKELEG